MTDHELLKFAAKAAGVSSFWSEIHETFFLLDKYDSGDEFQQDAEFNPLTDDGDALRLAVKLGLEIYYADNDGGFSYASYEEADRVTRYAVEPHGTDSCAATRRAIVRAAAEIGRKK